MAAPRPHVSSDVLVAGFDAARIRVEEADIARPEAFHAIFEVLAWVGVLRDRLREQGASIPKTLNGLYYVRNLALHQGADVLAWIPGATYGEATYGEST